MNTRDARVIRRALGGLLVAASVAAGCGPEGPTGSADASSVPAAVSAAAVEAPRVDVQPSPSEAPTPEEPTQVAPPREASSPAAPALGEAATTAEPAATFSPTLLPADGWVPDPLDGQVLPGPVPRPPLTQTVSYGPDPSHLIDLYLPDGPGPHPVIVWLHSGGWIGGTRADIPDVVSAKFADGWAIASVEYRLSPAVRFPVPVQDAEHAVRFVKANAAAFGLDPDTVVVGGASAGGHLAALVAASAGAFAPEDLDDAERAVSSKVAGLFELVGPVDLQAMIAAGGWGPEMVADFLDCERPRSRWPVCSEVALHVANPAVWADSARQEGRSLPPAFIAYGRKDTLIVPEPNGTRLFEAWRRSGGRIWYDYVDTQGHNLDVNGLNVAALDEFLDALRSGAL